MAWERTRARDGAQRGKGALTTHVTTRWGRWPDGRDTAMGGPRSPDRAYRLPKR